MRLGPRFGTMGQPAALARLGVVRHAASVLVVDTPVNLIDNGTFDSATPPPTLTHTGVGIFAIVSARLKFTGGNGNATAYWDVPGTIPGEAYYFEGNQTESTIAYPTVSLGGGTGVGFSDGVVGVHSATLVAGSANTRFVIQGTSGGFNSSRHFELDDLVLYRALQTLTLGQLTFGEETVVGGDFATTAVQNRASGSTLTLTNDGDGKFALSGTTLTLVAPLDYETATSHTIEITETLAGAYGSPKVSSITINVTDYAPTLAMDWAPDAEVHTVDPAGTRVGYVNGFSTGSTISLADSAGGKFSISLQSGFFLIFTAIPSIPPGDYDVTVRETNSDATNSPYDVTHTITISP